jgi:hypothetical protein
MTTIDDLIEQARGLEEAVTAEFDRRRDDFGLVIEQRRLSLSEEVAALQRRPSVSAVRYMLGSAAMSVIVAPILYVGVVPLALLDGFAAVYQAICFPLYGIPKVKRSDYLVLDRGDLPYLNGFEKLACVYCGYANGLAAYFREVAARTEQYWCPIKHARRTLAVHSRYPTFFEYGDAESYRLGLERLRESMKRAEAVTRSKHVG